MSIDENFKADVANTLAVLRENADAWQETADRYAGKRVLIGERLIVLDVHERAYSQFVEDGESKYKLELPSPDLSGVLFMNSNSAQSVRAKMDSEVPEFGPFVAHDFQIYAQSKANEANELAAKLAAANPDSTELIGRLQGEKKRETVYQFPVGHGHEAGQTMWGRLMANGFHPQWEDGVQGISLPVDEVSALRALQTSTPRTWGNHPDVTKMLDESQEKSEFVERLEESGVANAAVLGPRLEQMALVYTKLLEIQSIDGLSDEMSDAKENLREFMRKLVQTLTGAGGIKEITFNSDPRYATVVLQLASGRSNIMGGGWSVPVDQDRLGALEDGDDFWSAYAEVAGVGRIWWSADNLAEAQQWEADLTDKGARVELRPESDREIVDVIITLERARAKEILGHEVDPEEWMTEDGPIENAILAKFNDVIANAHKQVGAANTFCQVATEMLAAVEGNVSAMDWDDFNKEVIQRSIVQNKQPQANVQAVLFAFSPGAFFRAQKNVVTAAIRDAMQQREAAAKAPGSQGIER